MSRQTVSTHEQHMRRALDLAARAIGCTHPNPLVGAVVVRDGRIVGEGWHREAGRRHAEFVALADAGARAQGATLYVTLEPCNHHGRTPPCTDAILRAGVRQVVYAIADPNPRAAGGADRLQAAGIEVNSGVLEREARYLNRFFLHTLTHARPWVIAKLASSLDGRIATRTGQSQWITGQEARLRGHELRQAVDAVLVGSGTVIADDPALTVRLPVARLPPDQVRHPRAVVLDSSGRVPLESRLFGSDRIERSPTLLVHTDALSGSRHRELNNRGVETLCLPTDEAGGIDVKALLPALGKRGIQSVLVEGGPRVQGSFIDSGLVDEVWAFIAPLLIGGQEAPPSVAGVGVDQLTEALRLTDRSIEQLGDDILLHGLVSRSDASVTINERALETQRAHG